MSIKAVKRRAKALGVRFLGRKTLKYATKLGKLNSVTKSTFFHACAREEMESSTVFSDVEYLVY